MYLHLGQDTVINMKDIIGVFDMDNTTISKHTRQFLADAQKEAVEKDRKSKRIPALSGGAAPDKKGDTRLSEAEAWAAARAGLSREEYAKYKYAY